ncbi:hypothetical protein BJ742DRAFT_567720 [Cladochytrium replicatum]|nr:hypothetical protein BJ742DRAFT_567720 [Cladochytrium replicatum]
MSRQLVVIGGAVLLAAAHVALAADPTQLRLLNAFRAANGRGPLVELSSLDSCAYGHSVDMSNMGKMTHSGSDGSNGNIRINRCTGATYTGENVATGFSYVQNVMTAWENSPDHRANMLNPTFNVVGFGTYNSYWTQNFAYIAGVKPPTTTTRTTTRPSPSPSPAAVRTSAANNAATTTRASTASAAASSSPTTTDPNAEPPEPTYVPPENGVLLDVDSDSYIIPVTESTSSNGTTYDDSTGNAAIYVGDEERLAHQSTILLAKMDANAYNLYIQAKNTSVINPFLIVSFSESAGLKSTRMTGLECMLAVVGACAAAAAMSLL